MLSPEVFSEVRRLQILASRVITGTLSGEYRSAFRGRGMEFGEVREYQVGDDVRFIDWNVTARTGRPHVKKFIEERELTVLILLDRSASLDFGTARCLKNRAALELCALLTLLAAKNNDRVGLIVFTECVEKYIPPQKGIRHALRVVRDALCTVPSGRGTNLSHALTFLCRSQRRPAVAFVISDFHSGDFSAALSLAATQHDVVAVTITDPAERVLPKAGIVSLSDVESGTRYLIDSSDGKTREIYARAAARRHEETEALLSAMRIDHVAVSTGSPYLRRLIEFLRMRERRYHR